MCAQNPINKSRTFGSTWSKNRSQLWGVEACGWASGDQISGFSLRGIEENIYVFGFGRRSLDLHKSKRGGGGTNCLGCDMRQWQDSNYEPWELCDVVGFRFEDKQRHCGFVLCMYESSLLCRDVCLMSRTKFGFDTMLNLLVTRCVIPCCIC